MSPAALWRREVSALERWFLHAPLRFVAGAIVLWIAWAVASTALASLVRFDRPVAPVLGQSAPAREAIDVLLIAPLLENALLWLLFRAALFFAAQWWPRHAGAAAVGFVAAAFALGHWPFKVLYGVEVLAGGWLMAMCFLWGERHRLAARGWGLSVAAHVGVNAVALALFRA